MANELPDKLFFKIGDVAQIVGVRTHVLRYWESEFPALKPMKTRGAHRVYKRRDVELAMLIKRLVHDEGFTIPGARKRLKELGRDRVKSEPDPEAVREVGAKAELLAIRRSLVDVLEALDASHRSPRKVGHSEPIATVTSAVSSSVPVQRIPRES
jgi:DNA-binding transcriptional MerR regulator